MLDSVQPDRYYMLVSAQGPEQTGKFENARQIARSPGAGER
jgi:hypothetical protein